MQWDQMEKDERKEKQEKNEKKDDKNDKKDEKEMEEKKENRSRRDGEGYAGVTEMRWDQIVDPRIPKVSSIHGSTCGDSTSASW